MRFSNITRIAAVGALAIAVLVGPTGLSAKPVTSNSPPTTQTAGRPAQTSPSDVVRRFYDQLTDVMKQGEQLGFNGRYKKLRPAMEAAFNLPLMAKFSVGLDWAKATPDEQQQLTSAFSDFSVATYASQFKTYDGEQFQVTSETPGPDGVVVETVLKPKEGDPVTLNYQMKQDEKGNWRIVDVFLDGAISELATRRSEFTSIVHRDGITALVNSLGDKARQMGQS